MIKNWFLYYSPRYIRSLVYMLQASEYNIGDYFNWYRRTKDFSRVERRGHLVKTAKALMLYTVSWVILLVFYGMAFSLLWLKIGYLKYILFGLFLLVIPYLLAYAVIIPLLVFKIFAQYPLEYVITSRAKQKLKKHQALKIAAAGSFGKTSICNILKTVLSAGCKTAAPPQSFNTPLGISRFIKSLKGDEEILIFEFGEYYQRDIDKLCRLVKPQIGIITGINQAHLQKFKNIETTVKTIFELAKWLGKKPIYLNGESKLAKKNALSSNYIIYTRAGAGSFKVENARSDLNGTAFTLVKDNVRLEVKSKLLGLHQIGPLTAAADIAFNRGLTLSQIQQGISQTEPFEHRLKPKIDQNGVIILDDSYNGNPDGVYAVIDFLAGLKNKRRFYITPGLVEMGSQTELVHKKIGAKLSSAGIEKVILIKNSATPYIEKGLEEAKYSGEIIWFEDALSAFAALPQLTAKDDVVLLQNDWPDRYG